MKLKLVSGFLNNKTSKSTPAEQQQASSTASQQNDKVNLFLVNHNGDLINGAFYPSRLNQYPSNLIMSAAVNFEGSSATLSDVQWGETSDQRLDEVSFSRNSIYVKFNGEPIKYESREGYDEDAPKKEAILCMERDNFFHKGQMTLQANRHVNGPYFSLGSYPLLPSVNINNQSVDPTEVMKAVVAETQKHLDDNNIKTENLGAALAATGWGGYNG